MDAATAYNDCISAAKTAAERQYACAKAERDQILAEMHKTAAVTLEKFALLLAEMKTVRGL